MARTRTPANVVGPQIRKLRSALGLTQEEFASRCQLHGLDISRGTLSQIEAQLRCVKDMELLALAKVLKTSTDKLFTKKTKN
jgi:transcriptional regulator with XRE-family HTH domain